VAEKEYTVGVPRKRTFLGEDGNPEQGYRIPVILHTGARGYVDIPAYLADTPAAEEKIKKEVARLKKLSGL